MRRWPWQCVGFGFGKGSAWVKTNLCIFPSATRATVAVACGRVGALASTVLWHQQTRLGFGAGLCKDAFAFAGTINHKS